MTLSAVTIQGYRSVRSLYLPVEPCSVFVGANGVGKTNLYKALGLLRCAADGSITRAIAEEGGIESVLWAGGRRRGQPVRLILKAHFDEMDYGVEVGLPHSYEIEIGLRQPTEAAFSIEPLIKEERLTIRHGRRDVVMMERKGALVTLRNADGAARCKRTPCSLRRRRWLHFATERAIPSSRRYAASCWIGGSITTFAPTPVHRFASLVTPLRLRPSQPTAAIWRPFWRRCS